MVDLVTVEEAMAQSRIDASEDWLETWIPIVSQMIADWLKDPWRLYEWETDSTGAVIYDDNGVPTVDTDSDGKPMVSKVVKGACLVELASQYRYREGEGQDNVVPSGDGHGYILNKASTNLLAARRKTTVA